MAESALATVDRLYQDRGQKAKALKGEGRKTIGYLCCQIPAELMTAAGLFPFRITGDVSQTITQADQYIETIMCPFCRNAFDMGIRGEFDYLDGFVSPHSCDNILKIYDIWKYNIKPPYAHCLNVPHTDSASSLEFFKQEVNTLKRSLEAHIGKEISEDGLKAAVKSHNEYRALVRELYELSKPEPPLISAAERTKILLAGLRLPVDEAKTMLRGAIDEVKARGSALEQRPRLLLWGPEIDDVPFLQVFEDIGANVVIDDICVGTRPYAQDVPVTPDPLDGLAEFYLKKIMCPRTYRTRTGSREEDLENRFGYLGKLAKDYQVQGAVLLSINYCDTFEFESVEVKDYLQERGVPSMVVEIDYTLMSIDWLKTRIQAFLEMIS
jgi:bcr-type benzoyl-CoA reductase subunit C